MSARLCATLVAGAVSLLGAATALAHDVHLRVAAAQDVSEPCPGDPIDDGDPGDGPDRVFTGLLGDDLEGGYVLLPLNVPEGTSAVRVKYCWEQTGNPADPQDRSTLDLGLYETRSDESRPWGPAEFRGWGGSSHPDVIVSPHGFTSEARYLNDPERQVPGRTTRAFQPGPIPAGRWAVELGVAAVASSGSVPYRVEVELTDEDFPFPAYRAKRYDRDPVDTRRRWYAGDLHVHGEHSALGDAPMSEVFDYAFGPPGQGKAGLDFITLSDYVSGSSWGEVGRFQDQYPDNLIIRSAEVITYRGHLNSHGNTTVMDYRHGPLYQRRPNGTVVEVRGGRPARATFNRILAARGFTQINHPTIFPSPPFPRNQCRGCAWEYSDAETDYSKVDAIEIATGPAEFGPAGALGPNPFTVTGISFWEDALEAGHKIAAVGSSDSHNAGRTPGGITQAPIGTATTMVYAHELSNRGIRRAVRAGHTYVKVTGNDGPDVRLRATAPDAGSAIMGDTLRSGSASFAARVLGAGPGAADPGARQLIVMKDGAPFRTVPVSGSDFRFRFRSDGPGRYRLQLMRGEVIETVSSPIYLVRGRGQRQQTCMGRRATIVGTPGDDVLRGTPGRDVIAARGGDDLVRGRGGNDLICGGPGSDELRGNAGDDRLRGNIGDDRLLGQRGADDLRGGRGSDHLRGGRGGDEARGNRGSDHVRGGPGGDFAGGGPGPDRVHGGPGNDTVRGGAGRDRVSGGAGRDDVRQ